MLRVRSITSIQLYGVRYFEVGFEGENGDFIGSIDIPLYILKRKRVTKTLNGTKKLKHWLESDDGQIYAKEKLREGKVQK